MGVPTQTQASEQVKKVEQALSLAKGKWSGWVSSLASWYGESPRDTALNGLAIYERVLTKEWGPRRFKLAEIDQKGWNLWIDDGNHLLQSIADVAQDNEPAKLSNILAATAVQTVKDVPVVAAKVVEVAGTVGKYAVVGMVAAAVGVFVLWRMSKGK